MTRNEALGLADKINRSWQRGQIPTETWAEILEEMHHGPAEAALRKLRDTLDHQPSIAQYRSGYQAQLGTAHRAHVPCDTCCGDGWATTHYTVNGIVYVGVTPCRCRNGDDVKDVHKRIVTDNNAELTRLGITPDQHAIGPPVRHQQGELL